MKKKISIFQITLFIITVLFATKNSHAFSRSKVLTTDHFEISYNPDNSSCALAIAVRSESYHELISSFLQIEIPERFKIILTGSRDENFLHKLSYKIDNGSFYFSTDMDFSLLESELYNNIFTACLRKIMNNGKGCSLIDESFINAIILYPRTEPDFIKTQLSDLVNVSLISSIDLKKIDEYSSDKQRIIYTCLTDFIISNYGKKKFIHALKDTYYYDDFYLSLSKMTGDSISAISENFNSYLRKHKTDSDDELKKNKKQPLNEISAYEDISFSLTANHKAAVLQQNGNFFRLVLKENNNSREIVLNHSEAESIFRDLVFIDNNRIAIAEIIKSGSIIHIYDIQNSVFLNRVFLPLLFISDINSYDDTSFIFSALCGLKSDIYTYSLNSMKLSIITESGSNNFPVKIKDKLYFISNAENSSIIELDTASGKTKTLFKADSLISHLNPANERSLVFAVRINNLNSVCTLDIHTGIIRTITGEIFPCFAPQINGDKIYYFSFYKSRYHLFFNIYNAEDL